MTRIEVRPHRRRWIVASLAAVLSLIAMGAWAFGGRHHDGRRSEFHAFMLEKMLDQADASDEQRAQITDIMQAAHEDVAALREGSREELHTQVLDILTAETIDAAALDALRSEQQQRLEQAMARMSDALVQAANVLSQEQRVAIAEAVRERFESHGGRHGPRF